MLLSLPMPKILDPNGRLHRAVDATKRIEILKAIQEVGGSIEDAARVLGISRRYLYTEIDRLGLRAAVGIDSVEKG